MHPLQGVLELGGKKPHEFITLDRQNDRFQLHMYIYIFLNIVMVGLLHIRFKN